MLQNTPTRARRVRQSFDLRVVASVAWFGIPSPSYHQAQGPLRLYTSSYRTCHSRLASFPPSLSNAPSIGPLFILKLFCCHNRRLRAFFWTLLLSTYICCRSLSCMMRQPVLNCFFSRSPPQLPLSDALGGEFKDRANRFCGSMKSVTWLPLIAKYTKQKTFVRKTTTSTT